MGINKSACERGVLVNELSTMISKDALDFPDRACSDQLFQSESQWEKSNPRRLHEEAFFLLRQGFESDRLLRIHSEWLFTEYVLASLEAELDMSIVVRVRSRREISVAAVPTLQMTDEETYIMSISLSRNKSS